MITTQLLAAFITVIFGVIGWIVAHYFSSKRDRRLKRREIITTHLINAYRILANDIAQRESNADRDLKLETVIAELQLFGSVRQIELAKKLADDVAKGGDFYIDDLLNDLRNNLRTELELKLVHGNVRWLRFNRKK